MQENSEENKKSESLWHVPEHQFLAAGRCYETKGIENISTFSKSTKKSPKQEVPQNSLSQ